MSKATKIDDTAGFISFTQIWEYHAGGTHDWTAQDVRERLRSKTAEGFFDRGDGVRVRVPGHSGRLDAEAARRLRPYADREPSSEFYVYNYCWLSDSDYLRFCAEFGITPLPSRRPLAVAKAALEPIFDGSLKSEPERARRFILNEYPGGLPPGTSTTKVLNHLNRIKPKGQDGFSWDSVARALGRRLDKPTKKVVDKRRRKKS